MPYNMRCFGRRTNSQWKTQKVPRKAGPGFATNNMSFNDGSSSGDGSRNFNSNSVPVMFLSETSIHGMKYIAQEGRHWSERVFWLIAFLLGVLSSAFLIHKIWDRYNKTPVIVTFDVNEQNTSSVPFPAVTICNLNMMIRKADVEYLARVVKDNKDKSSEMYREASHKLELIRGMCDAQITHYKAFGQAYKKYNSTVFPEYKLWRKNRTDLLDYLREWSCGHFIQNCKFGGKIWSCLQIFRPVVTDYGKCCTFNMLPLKLLIKDPKNTGSIRHTHDSWQLDLWRKWDYEKEGIQVSSNSARPFRQKRAGRRYGLSFGIHLQAADEYICSVADSDGAQFTLHSPAEMPHVNKYSSAIEAGKEIFVEVSPDVSKADNDIRDFPEEKRKCVFGSERQLDFYAPYTSLGNCIHECVARAIVSKCQCASFHLPYYNNDTNSIRDCFSRNEQSCASKAQEELQDTMDEDCRHCVPMCEEIKYNHQTTVAKLKPVTQLISNETRDTRSYANLSIALLHIYFGSERTVPKLRKALYGIEDLIANTGGILGLCLGFSVLSGIELIYFFTLRTFWKHCSLRKTVKAKRNASRTGGHVSNGVFKSNTNFAWGSPRTPAGNSVIQDGFM